MRWTLREMCPPGSRRSRNLKAAAIAARTQTGASLSLWSAVAKPDASMPSEAPPQTKLIVSKRSPRAPPSYRRLANRILDPARPEEEHLTCLHHVLEVEDSRNTRAGTWTQANPAC